MDVVIFGCGGHGRVVQDILSYVDDVNVVGFVDDDERKVGKIINDTEVLGTSKCLGELQLNDVNTIALGIGDNYVRAKLFLTYVKKGFRICSAIHPSASISKDVKLGEGIVVMPGAIITTGSNIGNNVCVNTGAIIDHDNLLGDHSHVFPGANLTGGVSVGCYTSIGSSAVVNPNISIGNHVIVGSGTVVISDIPDNVTVVGVPGKDLKVNHKKEISR